MPNTARKGKHSKVLCWREQCAGVLGMRSLPTGTDSFSVAPDFVHRTDAVGDYWEQPPSRTARARRGEEVAHYKEVPGGPLNETHRQRRVRAASWPYEPRFAIWSRLQLPVRVRCPRCTWLSLVSLDAVRTGDSTVLE